MARLNNKRLNPGWLNQAGSPRASKAPGTSRILGRSLKGQTFQIEEMLGIFLVILVFGGVVLLIIGGWGGLNSVLNDFCEKNPSWCGASDATDADYATAKAGVTYGLTLSLKNEIIRYITYFNFLYIRFIIIPITIQIVPNSIALILR